MQPKTLEKYAVVNAIDPLEFGALEEPGTKTLELLFHSVRAEAEGRYKEALQLAGRALEVAEPGSISHFGARVMKFFSKVRLESSDHLETEFTEIDEHINHLQKDADGLNSVDQYNFHFFSAMYYTARSTYTFYQSNYQNAIDFNRKAINSWTAIQETEGVNLVSIDLQFCYTRTGQFDEALRSSDALLSQLNPDEDQLTYCHALLSRSEIFSNQGNYRIAASLLEDAYQLARELDIQEMIFHSMRFLADVYSKQGFYEKAWKLQQQALDHFSNSNPRLKAHILEDIGHTSRRMQEYQQARSYYQQSINQAKQVKSCDLVVDCYYHLILTEITDPQDSESLQVYFDRIDQHIKQVEDPRYQILPDLVQGLALLEERRLEKKLRAMAKFRDLIYQRNIYHEYRLTSIYYLTELLLDEYVYTREPSVIEEIESTLAIMQEIGSEMHSNQVLIDYYLLMMRFHRELGNYKMADTHLTAARQIAEKNKLRELEGQIETETELMKELELSPIINTADYLDIDRIRSITSYIQDLKQGRILRTSSEVQSHLFMIISKGGMNLYSRQFRENINPQHHLMASFISAMLDFSEEAFQDSSSVELIKLGSQKMVLHNLEDLVLCLVYEGNTPQAIRRLNNISAQLRNLTKIYAHLKIGLVEGSDRRILTDLTDRIFSTA